MSMLYFQQVAKNSQYRSIVWLRSARLTMFNKHPPSEVKKSGKFICNYLYTKV